MKYVSNTTKKPITYKNIVIPPGASIMINNAGEPIDEITDNGEEMKKLSDNTNTCFKDINKQLTALSQNVTCCTNHKEINAVNLSCFKTTYRTNIRSCFAKLRIKSCGYAGNTFSVSNVTDILGDLYTNHCIMIADYSENVSLEPGVYMMVAPVVKDGNKCVASTIHASYTNTGNNPVVLLETNCYGKPAKFYFGCWSDSENGTFTNIDAYHCTYISTTVSGAVGPYSYPVTNGDTTMAVFTVADRNAKVTTCYRGCISMDGLSQQAKYIKFSTCEIQDRNQKFACDSNLPIYPFIIKLSSI